MFLCFFLVLFCLISNLCLLLYQHDPVYKELCFFMFTKELQHLDVHKITALILLLDLVCYTILLSAMVC